MTYASYIVRIAWLVFLLFVLPGCNKDGPGTGMTDSKFWLINIDDGGKVTTTSEGENIQADVRMVVRGTFDGETPEGNWTLDFDQYTFMDMAENVQEDQILEGYYSGKNYYSSVSTAMSPYVLPIFDPTYNVTYYCGSGKCELPFFQSEPGKYYMKLLGDDGNTYEQNGSQLFMTCWPETFEMEMGGTSNDDLTTVRITFDMVDEQGISANPLTVYGTVYSFGTENEREKWIENHPLVNYLEEPGLIPFK
ncbi:MAG: hypothetical protein K9H26_11765 [Prolixibacteraceae bacterium]|nr:hypothetical protein [Prolixibacteraceae bacterium]